MGLAAGEPEGVHKAGGGLARVGLPQTGRAGRPGRPSGEGAEAEGRAGQFALAAGFVPGAAGRKRLGIHHR